MTTARVVSEVNAKKSQECFIKWMQDCNVITNRKIYCRLRKTVRCSYDKSPHRGAIHMVSAFSTVNFVVIEQVKID